MGKWGQQHLSQGVKKKEQFDLQERLTKSPRDARCAIAIPEAVMHGPRKRCLTRLSASYQDNLTLTPAVFSIELCRSAAPVHLALSRFSAGRRKCGSRTSWPGQAAVRNRPILFSSRDSILEDGRHGRHNCGTRIRRGAPSGHRRRRNSCLRAGSLVLCAFRDPPSGLAGLNLVWQLVRKARASVCSYLSLTFRGLKWQGCGPEIAIVAPSNCIVNGTYVMR